MSEQLTLDYCQARTNRDNGVQRAILNAEARDPEWPAKAFDLLLSYLETHDGEFQAEDVRVYATGRGLPEPPSNRSWGAVILRAAKLGWIKKAGIGPTSSPTAHCANASFWKKG